MPYENRALTQLVRDIIEGPSESIGRLRDFTGELHEITG